MTKSFSSFVAILIVSHGPSLPLFSSFNALVTVGDTGEGDEGSIVDLLLGCVDAMGLGPCTAAVVGCVVALNV